MRIGFFGDGGWAHLALERLAARRAFEIAFVVARHQQPDEVLRDWASRLSIPFYAPRDVNANSFISEIERHGPEVNVSMSYDQILRKRIIELAPMGFLNCHAGALPFYRGRNVLNWALINGENHFGVTVHYIDEGIDTGDIICQRFDRILPEDDYASLLDKVVRLCANTLVDALLQLTNGQIQATPQAEIHPQGFYCSRRREGDEWINWQWPSERIHNLVRAITHPGPGARTVVDDEAIVVLESALINRAPAYIDRPGTVVGRTDEGVVVKTGDTTLLLKRIATWTDGDIGSERTPRYSIGSVLGQSLRAEMERLRRRLEQLEKHLQ
jgi:methionyl-tRNA formyltransferase